MKNRKYLKLIWVNNRGNVRDIIKDYFFYIIINLDYDYLIIVIEKRLFDSKWKCLLLNRSNR